MSKKPPPPQKSSKPPEEEQDDGDDDEENAPTLKTQFVTFVQYKNEGNPGTHILLSQSDFWMKHAGVIKGRQLTQTDTGVCYFRFKKYKLTYEEYLEFLQVLADYKNIPVQQIIDQLLNCGPPPDGNANVALQR